MKREGERGKERDREGQRGREREKEREREREREGESVCVNSSNAFRHLWVCIFELKRECVLERECGLEGREKNVRVCVCQQRQRH